MKRFLTLLTVVAVAASWWWSGRGDERSGTAAAAPPLSLEGYLDEKLPEADHDRPKLKVDNSACYVCHENLADEPLVVRHGQSDEKIGCVKCHGESLAHRNDEDNVTPPDKMYGLRDIDRMCRECHESHDVAARKVLLRWKQRCPEKTDPRRIVCTDCHFRHRLAVRTVRWDKKTGRLLTNEPPKSSDSQPAGGN